MPSIRSLKTMMIFARLALAAAFLSAVVDRFGVWGEKGELGVSWATMSGFEMHVAKLCPWAPEALIPSLAWGVTGLEAVLAILLLTGLWLRETAAVTCALLLIFAASMGLFHSVKLMLNFSVLTCAACAGLVYAGAPLVQRERDAATIRHDLAASPHS